MLQVQIGRNQLDTTAEPDLIFLCRLLDVHDWRLGLGIRTRGVLGGTSLSAAKGVAAAETTPFAVLRDVPPLGAAFADINRFSEISCHFSIPPGRWLYVKLIGGQKASL